ncbi:DUF1513 domain-containing protein [Pseudoteredinibacter isoporae]|uniref:DUF1513 domain-containing protein n=1 Tax=Pseudoteredinibacter isoporae TaxID=570281 RepID=UPI0031027CF3
MTAIDRRTFLLGSAGYSLAALMACAPETGHQARLLSGFQSLGKQGRKYGVAAIDLNGRLRFSLTLPQRLHQIITLPASHPGQSRECLAVARRPGTELYHIDVDRGQLLNTIRSPGNRHFFGHASCVEQGDYIVVPQNHLDEKASSIGIYDRKEAWALIDEIPLPTVGPHQLECLSDGKTLVVAMGGIHTHPESGRKKLNIDSMQSSLLYLDSGSGKVLDDFRPPDPKLSLRHLAITSDDHVIVGAQYQGDGETIWPLAYSHKGESSLQALSASQEVWRLHQQYIGSVSVEVGVESARFAYLSSPRGGVVSRWDLHSGECIEHRDIRDACGVAFSNVQHGFFISNGAGQMLKSEQNTGQVKALAYQQGIIWDNHLSFIM